MSQQDIGQYFRQFLCGRLDMPFNSNHIRYPYTCIDDASCQRQIPEADFRCWIMQQWVRQYSRRFCIQLFGGAQVVLQLRFHATLLNWRLGELLELRTDTRYGWPRKDPHCCCMTPQCSRKNDPRYYRSQLQGICSVIASALTVVNHALNETKRPQGIVLSRGICKTEANKQFWPSLQHCEFFCTEAGNRHSWLSTPGQGPDQSPSTCSSSTSCIRSQKLCHNRAGLLFPAGKVKGCFWSNWS